MQDSGHSDLSPQIPLVFGKFLKGFLGGLEQTIEGDSLMSFDRFSNLGRNGEGHQEILHWQELLTLPLKPFRGLVILALRATPMAAGMRPTLMFPALWADHQHFPGFCAPADLDSLHGFLLPGQNACLIFPLESGLILFDDGCQIHSHSAHRIFMPPTRRLIATDWS